MSAVQPAACRSGTVAKNPHRGRSVSESALAPAWAFLKITSANPPEWHWTITSTTCTFGGRRSSRPTNSFTAMLFSFQRVSVVLRAGFPPPPWPVK